MFEVSVGKDRSIYYYLKELMLNKYLARSSSEGMYMKTLQNMPAVRRINQKALRLLQSLPSEFNHKDLIETGTSKCGFRELLKSESLQVISSENVPSS